MPKNMVKVRQTSKADFTTACLKAELQIRAYNFLVNCAALTSWVLHKFVLKYVLLKEIIQIVLYSNWPCFLTVVSKLNIIVDLCLCIMFMVLAMPLQ